MRTFTTNGPGDDSRHYLLPAAVRLAEVRSLVDQGAYFMVRAPARTGKTTSLRALAAFLTTTGRYAAMVCSAALSAPAVDDFARAEQALLSSIRITADQDLPPELRPPPFASSTDGTRIWEVLTAWARVCPRPVIIFFDEIDTLHGAALQSILRQLEAGFSGRPQSFPWSIALVGQFDIRTSAAIASADPVRSGALGPFALGAPCETLHYFTAEEVRALYSLHTAETQQVFEPEALDFVHQATSGHPFLVQALGRECARIAPAAVTKEHMLTAARRLIQQHMTPVEALATRLSDPRVQRVIEPLLAGTAEVAAASEDDVQFVRDLGLLHPDNPAQILGSMHQAIISRVLAQGVQRAITENPAQFFETDGRLSIERLLHGFAVFYSVHAKQLTAAITYQQVAPELVFFGFLLSALEGRGWVDFDYGNTRGRIDITITVPIAAESADSIQTEQCEVIVIVSRRKGEKGAKTRGLAWLENALEEKSCGSGTLVVFDRRDKHRPGKRIKLQETSTATGRMVKLLRA